MHIAYRRCIHNRRVIAKVCCAFWRTSEQRAKKIAAYATDASGIDRQKRNGGRGRARGGILLRLFPQVGTRCIASGQFGRKTHPNHVRSGEFAMPRALNMQFITHEGLHVRRSQKERFFRTKMCHDGQKLVI